MNMGSRPPEAKRMRADPNMPADWVIQEGQQHHVAQRGPPPHPPPPDRRHSELLQHYDSGDPRRYPQPPFDPYGVSGPPRDSNIIKPEPSPMEQMQGMRPHSTGHLIEGRPRPPMEDMRGIPQHMAEDPRGMPQNMFDPRMVGPPQPQIHFAPPPQPPMHGLPPPAFQEQRPQYEQPPPDYRPPEIYAEFTGNVTSTQKKKAPRTSQACEACRIAKAKCGDPKPCAGCLEKGIPCKYDPPALKATDKAQSDILTLLQGINQKLDDEKKFRRRAERVNMRLQREINYLRKLVQAAYPNLTIEFPDEPEELEDEEDEEEQGAERKESEKSESKGFSKSAEEPMKSIEIDTVPAVPPDVVMESTLEIDESEELGDASKPPKLGEPAIPQGHTTGAQKLLQWPCIEDMLKKKMEEKNIKGDPMIKEWRRGTIRLYGRGEGTESYAGYDRDAQAVSTEGGAVLDPQAQTLPTAEIDSQWGQIGDANPMKDAAFGSHASKVGENLGLPDFSIQTVKRLSASYMHNLNRMHPIITPDCLRGLTKSFMRQIRNSERAHSPNGKETKGKRKRSPSIEYRNPFLAYLQPGRPQRSLGTAIMLMILALGKICEHRERIPNVVQKSDQAAHHSDSPSSNGIDLTPIPSTPASSLQSPIGQPGHINKQSPNFTRRGSVESAPMPRNLDVIPGLAYFAVGSDILGNHMGSHSLQYVHAYILASLYYGQLGRVLQSHACIKEAGYALTVVLGPRLTRFKIVSEGVSDDSTHKMKTLPKDNPFLFAFWTCLQLESDIVAELNVPQSVIMSLESMVPWPNFQFAMDNNEMDTHEVQCYSAQLWFRKELNKIHRDLYGPGKEIEFNLSACHNWTRFPVIESIVESLGSVSNILPNMVWDEQAPPSPDILDARARAKLYGAQVITYRYFLRMLLDNYYSANPIPLNMVSEKIQNYAKLCVDAMIQSTRAFTGIKGGRLIVTNVWGTSHAQWGNVIALHAVYRCEPLSHLIDADILQDLSAHVRDFLMCVAQPSSALMDDIRILDLACEVNKLPPKRLPHGPYKQSVYFKRNMNRLNEQLFKNSWRNPNGMGSNTCDMAIHQAQEENVNAQPQIQQYAGHIGGSFDAHHGISNLNERRFSGHVSQFGGGGENLDPTMSQLGQMSAGSTVSPVAGQMGLNMNGSFGSSGGNMSPVAGQMGMNMNSSFGSSGSG